MLKRSPGLPSTPARPLASRIRHQQHSIMPAPTQVSGGHNSIIDYKNKRFIITDRPTDATIAAYVKVPPPVLSQGHARTSLTTLVHPTSNNCTHAFMYKG